MLSILAFLGSGVGLGLLKFALEAFLESRRQKSDQEHRENRRCEFEINDK
mgnify:CR=1 FL=1